MSLNILLTGLHGLLGSAINQALKQSGRHNVVGIAREGPSGELNISYDLTRGAAGILPMGFPFRPDLIIHTAAVVPNQAKRADTDLHAKATQAIDQTVLDLARKWDCAVLYTSGCSLYERSFTSELLTENSPLLLPTSPYLQAKAEGERRFLEIGGGVMRISSPYGISMKPTVVLHKFISRARTGLPIEVWGDGSREQDFVHVKDVARFCLLWTDLLQTGIFNVANSRPVSMIDLANLVVSAVGRGSVALNIQADPLNGQKARFSIEKAHQVLGWQPQVSLEDGVRELMKSKLLSQP